MERTIGRWNQGSPQAAWSIVSDHLERAAEHAAAAEAVFNDPSAPVEPYVEAMLAVYEVLMEMIENDRALATDR